MDSDFWASRLAAAKRQFTLQNHHQHHGFQLDRMNFDEFEVEDEVRPDFPYPHSYEDVDLASLYSHLEDEHACESKVAVCPICSVKVVTDMLSHITLQHGHLFKLQRRRRLRRVAIPNSQALSLLGRDLREAHLEMLLGGGGYRSSNANSSTNAVTTDPFLSSLILKFPTSESEDISKTVASGAEESSTKSATSSHLWKTSFDPSLSSEEREKRMRQAAGRVGFLQDLLVSTLLGD